MLSGITLVDMLSGITFQARSISYVEMMEIWHHILIPPQDSRLDQIHNQSCLWQSQDLNPKMIDRMSDPSKQEYTMVMFLSEQFKFFLIN